MNDSKSIEIAVLSARQDDVELVNRTMRDAGSAAHCHWVAAPPALDRTLESREVELLIVSVDSYPDTLRQVVRQKDSCSPELPVIALSRKASEDIILAAMKQGASDLVSIDRTDRLRAIVMRELRAFRMERALSSTINTATQYRRQLHDYMQGSSKAIAYAQEGIVTDVNAAWLQLFGIADKEALVGLPLMDCFEAQCQAAIKGAIVATVKGKWQHDESLLARSRLGRNEMVELLLRFQLVDFDDGAHVQVVVEPPKDKADREPTSLVHEALKRDPTTLFFHRAQFLERLEDRLAKKPQSGVHVVAMIKPDHFSELRKVIGILHTEEILSQFAEEVRKRMHPRDFAGRFEGTTLMVLLERGTERDAEVWAQQLVEHLREHDFRIDQRSVSITCTVAICTVTGVYSSLEELVTAVAEAQAQGRKAGGNGVFVNDTTDADTRLRKYDAIWVRHIKAALMENRFRLAQLPIAGLRSGARAMYDLLVRMIDEQGNTVLPSDFLPAAERNNLIKTIDRWIVSAALDFCARNSAECVFVRLSIQSLLDSTLVDWMKKEFGRRRVAAEKLVVQIGEREAAKSIKPVKKVVDQFKAAGIRFALEHYGIDKNRFQILDILRPDYIKIDGELMHSLTADTMMQENVRIVAEAAEQRGIRTIAERVENANSMAILFQLGVHYMQGHYVHEPEVVLQEPPSVSQTTLDAMGSS